jgi:PAS domain S-box-containing protein
MFADMSDGPASAAEAIRDASERLDDGDKAVIGTDNSGTIVYWNGRAVSLYGWHAPDVIGRNVLDVTPSLLSQTEAEAIMHRLLAGETWSGRFNVRDKTGRPLQVHVTDVPVHFRGKVVGIVGLSVPSPGP